MVSKRCCCLCSVVKPPSSACFLPRSPMICTLTLNTASRIDLSWLCMCSFNDLLNFGVFLHLHSTSENVQGLHWIRGWWSPTPSLFLSSQSWLQGSKVTGGGGSERNGVNSQQHCCHKEAVCSRCLTNGEQGRWEASVCLSQSCLRPMLVSLVPFWTLGSKKMGSQL